MKNEVFRYTNESFSLSVSGAVSGRQAKYLSRMGKASFEDMSACVEYKFSSPPKNLQLWDDSEGKLLLVESGCGVATRPVFFETRYFFRADFAPSVKSVRVVHPLAAIAESFDYLNGTLVGSLDFINTPGRFSLKLEIREGDSVRYETIEWIVVSVKMDVVADYKAILAAIEKEQKNLVYAFVSKTLTDAGYCTEDCDENRVVWYSIFEKVFNSYKDACEKIIHQPYLKYVEKVYYQRADRIKRWSPRLVNAFTQMDCDRQANGRFRTVQLDPEIDTVENRFVLWTLKGLSKKLCGFADELAENAAISDEYVKGLRAQVAILDELADHRFFQRVGYFAGFRQESLVLQKRQGYAQVYAAWLALKNGLSPVGDDVQIGQRPISTLYEFWCFLTLRQILKDKFGEPIENIGDLSNISELLDEEADGQKGSVVCKMDVIYHDVATGRQITLSYQKSYHEKGEYNFAHLHAQRPDIVVSIKEENDAVFTYLFDAKYRIDEIQDLDASPRDAIDDMHRYRDAILYRANKRKEARLKHEVIGAYVLYPGKSEMAFDYSEVIAAENIGAIPLLPSDDGRLREFIEQITSLQGVEGHLEQAIVPRETEIRLVPEQNVMVVRQGKDSEIKRVENGAYLYQTPLSLGDAIPQNVDYVFLVVGGLGTALYRVIACTLGEIKKSGVRSKQEVIDYSLALEKEYEERSYINENELAHNQITSLCEIARYME